MEDAFSYDIAILGAGPAGSTAALALQHAGLRVALLDKATFPRDKVCGDAIPGLGIKVLRQLAPEFAAEFDQLDCHLHTRRTRFIWEDSQELSFQWVLPAYTCKRIDFDDALLSLVSRHTQTDIRLNTPVSRIVSTEKGVSIHTQQGTVQAKILIGCDGSRSLAARALRSEKIDRVHHGGAVRAYVTGISDMHSDQTEIFVQKRFLPGYFWCFPLPNGGANIGFGMQSEAIANRKVNLREALKDFIAHSPVLRDRFKNAHWVGGIQGYGLPFGSQQVQVSGKRILLAGDAACLVDPFSGDGIGNAMLSGRMAAERAVQALEVDTYDDAFLKGYDQQLWNKLGHELQLKTRVQRFITAFPALLPWGMRFAKIPPVKRWLHRTF